MTETVPKQKKWRWRFTSWGTPAAHGVWVAPRIIKSMVMSSCCNYAAIIYWDAFLANVRITFVLLLGVKIFGPQCSLCCSCLETPEGVCQTDCCQNCTQSPALKNNTKICYYSTQSGAVLETLPWLNTLYINNSTESYCRVFQKQTLYF